MADAKLIEAVKGEQARIASKLCNQNPQWRYLQGILDALEGRVQLTSEDKERASDKEGST